MTDSPSARKSAIAGAMTSISSRPMVPSSPACGLSPVMAMRGAATARPRRLFRRAEGEEWPDLSDAALAASAEEWLAPFITRRASLAEHYGRRSGGGACAVAPL